MNNQPNPYQPPQPLYTPPPTKPPKPPFYRRRGCLISLGVVIVLLVGFVALGLWGETLPQQPTSAASITPTSQPTHAIARATPPPTATPKPKPTIKPTPKPTTAPASHWPPKTQADLHALAALGDANAIHEFHSESVGMTGACPQPERDVTVDPSITGKQLAEDLLAYWYAQQLENPCGAVVFAYHSQSEAGNGYTAGRINLDVTDASGQANTDPNATGLKYSLTLDTGGALDPNVQEYVVNW